MLRVVDAIGNLRKRHMYKALREATISVAMRELNAKHDGAFRIVHISIQRNHVHLLVEADHKIALSRGMQSFQISAAKRLNRAVSLKRMGVVLARRGAAGRAGAGGASGAGGAGAGSASGAGGAGAVSGAGAGGASGAGGAGAVSGAGAAGRAFAQAMRMRRRGTVFPDRFHQEIIKTPKQARHTLAYVLNNWRKHREDDIGKARTWKVDPFSTGVLFDGWKEREHADTYMRYDDDYEPLVVYLPRTWLLYEGWRKHGLIGFDFVPSAKQMARVFDRAA